MKDKVKVKIKPLHNIGGVGKAGDVVWMLPAEAEAYARDGYVEYVNDEGRMMNDEGASTAPVSTPAPLSEEDHVIMKPEVKRAKKVVRKK